MLKDKLNELYRGGQKAWMMAPAEKFALEACILEGGPGDYVEIGVNRGGSLVFACLLKKAFDQAGKCYGIEASIGYKPEIEKLASGLLVDVNVVYKPSDPWPGKCMEPVVAFIDGDHYGDMPVRDWNNLKDRTKRFILFHDCNEGSDVERAVENAKADTSWTFVGKSGCMAVFERCGSS